MEDSEIIYSIMKWKSEGNRKYKNRQNSIKNKDIYINNISLFDIASIMVLFVGGIYFIFFKANYKKCIREILFGKNKHILYWWLYV